MDIRAIFGFLCFDHVGTDYFRGEDEKVGYIFADLLSLFIIDHLTYTDYSTTYQDCLKIIYQEKEKEKERKK